MIATAILSIVLAISVGFHLGWLFTSYNAAKENYDEFKKLRKELKELNDKLRHLEEHR